MPRRRRRRRHRPRPLREQCNDLLRFFLTQSLLDRVPLRLLGIVLQTEVEQIVDTFMADNAKRIEEAISEVEANPEPWTNVTDVVDVVMDDLLAFAKERGDYLDKPLSPYAGLKP